MRNIVFILGERAIHYIADIHVTITDVLIQEVNKITEVSLSWIIMGVGSANKKRRYIVTSSLIGWGHIQDDPCIFSISYHRPGVLTPWGLLVHDWGIFILLVTCSATSHFLNQCWLIAKYTLKPRATLNAKIPIGRLNQYMALNDKYIAGECPLRPT